MNETPHPLVAYKCARVRATKTIWYGLPGQAPEVYVPKVETRDVTREGDVFYMAVGAVLDEALKRHEVELVPDSR